MSEYTIQIGATSDSRHIGIQPPVDESLRSQIFEELGDEVRVEAANQGFALDTARTNSSSTYSELMLNATWMVRENLTSKEIAGRVAEVIRAEGHLAEVQPNIISLGHDSTLFELSAVA